MMEPGILLEISREAVFVLLKISLPVLSVTLVVGLIISLFQAITQIQETSLSFVPKIIAVFLTLLFLMPYMSDTLLLFSERIGEAIINLN